VKVVRVNNFVSSKDSTTSSKSNSRVNATSHSPLSLAGTSKDGSTSVGGKLRKGIKVINQPDKSPYINNCFDKNAVNQISSSSNPTPDSAASSAKANRKGAASAEISESSLIVLKKANKSSA
jgi:hypothetical protein